MPALPTHISTSDTEKGATIRRVTWGGLWANLALAAVKALAGLLGASQALLADAVHSLSDTASDIAVLVGSHYWTAPADDEHPHGHERIETVVTLGIGALLGGAAAGLLYRAVTSIHTEGPPDAPHWTTLGAAILSMVVKEILYRWSAATGRRIKSSALIANAWHHRSDALSSIPVAVAVGATLIRPEWAFLDAIGAALVALLILQAAWRIARPAFEQLIDRGASQEEVSRIEHLAGTVEGVKEIHSLRTRYQGSGLVADMHVLVDDQLSVRRGHEIATRVKRRLIDEGPDVVDVVVHIEPYRESTHGRDHAGPAPS